MQYLRKAKIKFRCKLLIGERCKKVDGGSLKDGRTKKMVYVLLVGDNSALIRNL